MTQLVTPAVARGKRVPVRPILIGSPPVFVHAGF